MPNGRKGKFTAELLFDPGFEIKVEKLSFTVNGAQGPQRGPRLLLERA